MPCTMLTIKNTSKETPAIAPTTTVHMRGRRGLLAGVLDRQHRAGHRRHHHLRRRWRGGEQLRTTGLHVWLPHGLGRHEEALVLLEQGHGLPARPVLPALARHREVGL